jgi:hypothetical protein
MAKDGYNRSPPFAIGHSLFGIQYLIAPFYVSAFASVTRRVGDHVLRP